MGSQRAGTRLKRDAANLYRQSVLLDGHEEVGDVAASCKIVSVGRRRDGGTRYWCLAHRADATAKYGRRAVVCRGADVPVVSERDTQDLHLDRYPGGVALWGAVPPVYDTTLQPLDRGIHIHARLELGSQKILDDTVSAVRVFGIGLPTDGILVTELDAIYHMVSSVFGYETKPIGCTHCAFSHLDRDWFSVHPHQRHLCAGCGRYFRDHERGIGNPTEVLRAALGMPTRTMQAAGRTIDIRQSDYPGGVQIWGSNPAFLWTSRLPEDEGIHLHAFANADDAQPVVDETFSRVVIDGLCLDPVVVRVSMAQAALPHLSGRILSATCPSCETPKFCGAESAFTPSRSHTCDSCGQEFSPRCRMRNTILNPLPGALQLLAEHAPRPPQSHNIGVLADAP